MYFARFSSVSPFTSNTKPSVNRSNRLGQKAYTQALTENSGGDQLLLQRSMPTHGTLAFKGASQIVVSTGRHTLTFDPEKQSVEIFDNTSKRSKSYPLSKKITTLRQAETNFRITIDDIEEDLTAARQRLEKAERIAQGNRDNVPALREKIKDQDERAKSAETEVTPLKSQLTAYDDKVRKAKQCTLDAETAWRKRSDDEYASLQGQARQIARELSLMRREINIPKLRREAQLLESEASRLRQSNKLIEERIERTERLDKRDIQSFTEKVAQLEEKHAEYQRLADLLAEADQVSSRQNLKVQASQKVNVAGLQRDFNYIEELMRTVDVDTESDNDTKETVKSSRKAATWASHLPEFEPGPMEEPTFAPDPIPEPHRRHRKDRGRSSTY